VFFGLFLLPQNLKVAIYKGYIVSRRSKKAKKNVVIAVFLKIEVRLKALSVRFWGIPEGGLKPFQIKGLCHSCLLCHSCVSRNPVPSFAIPARVEEAISYVSNKKMTLIFSLFHNILKFFLYLLSLYLACNKSLSSQLYPHIQNKYKLT